MVGQLLGKCKDRGRKLKRVAILGAGITGLTCSSLLKDTYDVTIIERDEVSGGLCQSFEKDGFWFDYGAHAAFTKDESVRKLLEENLILEESLSEAMNYKKEKWIKQPVQNNLFALDTDEKIKIIKGFIERNDDGEYKNYGEWLEKNYGKYFAENYPYYYTRKYWTVEPSQLETKWIGPRMYTPSIEEVLYGSYSEETPNIHYAGNIRYPVTGGFARFLEKISKGANVIYNAKIAQIDTKKKCVYYNNTRIDYDEIISTIPLPEIVKLLDCVPEEVQNAALNLDYTTLTLVSLGIGKKDVMPNHVNCFYIYDQDILASRVFSTSEYGRQNAPLGCTSIQAEIYSSKYKVLDMSLEEIKEKVIDDFTRMGLFQRKDIMVQDVRRKKYANIIFTKEIYNNRKIVHDFLEQCSVLYAGRFGKWDYLWSDQSVLSAIEIVDKI